MSRPKLDNPMNETILIRMDRKLRNQLERYAKSKNKKLATQAREALQLFINEQKQNEQNKNLKNPQC